MIEDMLFTLGVVIACYVVGISLTYGLWWLSGTILTYLNKKGIKL